MVSSDDRAILDVAVEFGAEPLLRPAELARDDSPTAPLVRHAIEQFGERGQRFDFTVLLQPTSPLRSAQDIDAAIDLIRTRQADALISVYEPAHTPFKAFVENAEGYLSGLIDDETPFKRRQDLPRALMPNGAIYIVATEYFLRTGRFFSPRTVAFEMPADSNVDIDGEEDLEAALKYLRRHGRVRGEERR